MRNGTRILTSLKRRLMIRSWK